MNAEPSLPNLATTTSSSRGQFDFDGANHGGNRVSAPSIPQDERPRHKVVTRKSHGQELDHPIIHSTIGTQDIVRPNTNGGLPPRVDSTDYGVSRKYPEPSVM